MVNPACRLLLGMVVLLSGVETLSAQAQYSPDMGAMIQPVSYNTAAAYRPDYQPQNMYEPSPDYYQSVDGYPAEYYGGMPPSDSVMRVLPEDRGWGYDHPMDGLFKNLANNSWMRIEYLLWKAPPGNMLIGTQNDSNSDPRNAYITDDFLGFPTLSTKAADLGSIGKNGSNGIRGTFGIDFDSGTIEAIFFGMKTDTSGYTYDQNDLLGASFGETDMISIPLLFNGQISNAQRNFNEKFRVSYKTQAWGAESNYVFNTERLFFRTYYGAGGLQIRPLVGFRYLKIGEEMVVKGEFERADTIPPFPLFDSTIRSQTHNSLYVPQAGIRMEFVHPWFTISAEPKFGFGVNQYNGNVMTDQFLGPDDPTHYTSISATRFSPTFEFGINARFHLSEYFTFNVGYNFLWANHVARAGGIPYYNLQDSFAANDVSIRAQDSTDTYKLHGLVIGGEFSWP
ncbi:BBP7 family outer membrane beta-barrel protein [Gimesia sp.]|uniref:BBP7 family outer membrane beta-barrel protein n=1 Tax=Gimesia sp. TaxID=2024833 RepID=UPI003A94EC46